MAMDRANMGRGYSHKTQAFQMAYRYTEAVKTESLNGEIRMITKHVWGQRQGLSMACFQLLDGH